jgi:hypothetical protein
MKEAKKFGFVMSEKYVEGAWTSEVKALLNT